MKFGEAVKTCIEKYAYFNGRARRSEFWWWALFALILGIAAELVSEKVGTLVTLLILFPSLAVTSRRLHDIGGSGWWQLIGFIPLLGLAVIIYWCVQDTTGDNIYGEANLNGQA